MRTEQCSNCSLVCTKHPVLFFKHLHLLCLMFTEFLLSKPLSPTFCRKWEPGAANTPWLWGNDKPHHCWGQILTGSSWCMPHANLTAWGATRLPWGHKATPQAFLCCAAPKEAHFNTLISRTAFMTCSCGAKEPCDPWHTETIVGQRELWGFWSDIREWTELLCSGVERGIGVFLYLSGYFGPLSLLNYNSSSTVMGEWARINLLGFVFPENENLNGLI